MKSVARAGRSAIRDQSTILRESPGFRFAHPGLYGVVVVKGIDSSGHGFAFSLERDALVVALSSRWIAAAPGAATVKAGRRPPPEAARSGLDGGEAGAKLSDRDVSRHAIDSLT